MADRDDVNVGAITEIALVEMQGEPRARDLDLAERLGMSRPRDIRKLIARHRGALEEFGALAVIRGEYRGQPTTEYCLNEEQALLTAVLSDAPRAPAVRAMLIRVFVAWRRGHMEQLDAKTVGGIMKGVVHKQLNELVQDLLPAAIREAVGSSQFGVVHGMTAGDVLDAAGVADRKGLRGLARRASDRLRRFHAEKSRPVRIATLGRSSAYVFDPLTAREWLDEGGRATIQGWVAERRGQGVLKLVPRPAN